MIRAPRTISFGLVDEDVVFMDLESDTYFCLEPAHCAELIGSVRHRELLGRDDPRLDALGISNEPVELVRADSTRPARSLVDSPTRSPPRLADVVTIALLLRNTRRRLGRQPIDACLPEFIPARRREGLLEGGDWVAWSERFLRARKLVPLPARDRCLLDSVTLLRWLGGRHDSAALVFGVKLNPFAAHCWVQADELVLNDRLENVAPFTPVRTMSCSGATH